MSIKIHFQLPEPAVLCVVHALLAAWVGSYQSIVCCSYENLYHDPRHKVGVCHVSSIVTQFWNISTPRPHISSDAASYYATVNANLLVRGNLRAVHFTRHNLMLKWGRVCVLLTWAHDDGEQTSHRRHLNVRRRIMSSDKWHVFVVTTETFAWKSVHLQRQLSGHRGHGWGVQLGAARSVPLQGGGVHEAATGGQGEHAVQCDAAV